MLLLCFALAAGFALARALWPAPRTWSACDPIRLALAPLLGTGLASLVFYFVRVLAGGPPVSAIGTFLVAGIAAAAAAYLRSASAEADPAPHPRPAPFWLNLLAGAAVVIGVLSYVLMVAAAPHGEWDAWSIWNLRARFLFRGTEFASAFSPLLDWAHPDYPLLIPASLALFWHGAGEESLRAAAVLQGTLALSAIAVPFTVMRHIRGGALAAVTALAIAGGSSLARNAATLYSDVPLAAAMVAACACLSLAMETGRRGPMLLAGLAAGLAAWTKNEGQLFFLAVLAGAIHLPRSLPWFAAGAAPALAAVAVFKANATAANSLISSANAVNYGPRLTDLNRYWISFWGFVSESLTFSHYLLPPVVVFGVWLALVKLDQPVARRRLIPLLAATIQLSGYFLIFVATVADIDWHVSTALGRLLLHVWPLALFGVFLISADPAGER